MVLLSLAAVLPTCSSISDRPPLSEEPLLSILHESGDAVGIIQKIDYFPGGRIRLLGADHRRYSSKLERLMAEELERRLKEEALIADLRAFGASPRYPNCLVTEMLEIHLAGTVRRGRIDALSGSLLELAAFLESILPSRLRDHYQISIVERTTAGHCARDSRESI